MRSSPAVSARIPARGGLRGLRLLLCSGFLAAYAAPAPAHPSSARAPSSADVTGLSTSNTFPGGQSLPAGAQVTSVVRFDDHYVAAGALPPGTHASPPECSTSGCNPMVWTSTDEKEWTPTWGSSPAGSIAGEQLVVAPTVLLLFNDDEGTGLWRSTNAVTWRKVLLPPDMAALDVTRVVWGHGRYVAILDNKFAGGPDTAYGESDTIWTSTNATTWRHDPVAGSRLRFASLGVDATGFAVRGTADGTPSEWTSRDGVTWTTAAHPERRTRTPAFEFCGPTTGRGHTDPIGGRADDEAR